MSSRGSGEFAVLHDSGSLKYAPMQEAEAETPTHPMQNVSLDVDVDVDVHGGGGGNGGGGKGKGHHRKKTIEERARVLGAGEIQQAAGTSTSEAAPTFPVPQPYVITPQVRISLDDMTVRFWVLAWTGDSTECSE